MKQWVKIFFILFCSFSLKGQTPHFKSHLFPEAYKKTIVNTILEAHDGFLWFGTSDGLFRYNGLEFIPVSFMDTLRLSDVTALFQDAQHTIWIGTKNGAIYFFEKNKSLQEWKLPDAMPTSSITGFEETKDGIFWISTYGEGIYYYENKKLQNLDIEDGLTDIEIYSMIRHRDNHILASTDAGISVCKIKDGKKQIIQLTSTDGLSDEIVKTLLPSENGNFWAGTYDHGVDFWNAKNQTFESVIPGWTFGEINHLEVFKDKEIWIGTDGNGLFRFDLKTKHLQKIILPRFENSKIYDLHKDVEGNLWVLNNRVGVSSANRQFEQIAHQLENIQAVLTDKENRIWLGTSKGLFQMKNQPDGTVVFEPYLSNKNINVISLYEDIHGHIWIGTFGQGLYCFNYSKKNEYKYFSKENGLYNDNILSIDGSEKMIWLATLGGVYELDLSQNIFSNKNLFRNYTNDDGLGTNFIYKVFVSSQHQTWFGTDGKGISVLTNGKITNYQEANGLPLKTVYTIAEDHRGHIWFGTAEQGIFEFDGEKFIQLNVKEGIRDLEITSLVTDSLGNILIVHPTGIDILNPKTKHLIYYDEEVGVEDLESTLNAFDTDKNGNIWMGAKDKIIRYSALKELLEIHPRNRIEKVNVFFEPVDFKTVSKFQHTQNSLVFDYIGLWYTDPEKVEYRYQLEGYNQDWIHSKDKQAHYSNLPPGNYVFKMTSTENGAFDGEPITSYSFKINAPFWQQTWFFIFAITLLVGLIYAWSKWKRNQLQREAAIQKERIESQLEVLKSQINPHFLFNSFNTLITLIEEEPEDATEYVEKLSDFYRSLLQYREKDLIPLQEEFDLLYNFEFLLKKRFGENIHLEIPKLNGQIAFVPPLTLQMIFENAIKHNIISKSKPLRIKLSLDKEKIIITNNLQRKLTAEKSTHFGLQSIKTRYALLGKDNVLIEETPKEFKVIIPIIKEH